MQYTAKDNGDATETEMGVSLYLFFLVLYGSVNMLSSLYLFSVLQKNLLLSKDIPK